VAKRLQQGRNQLVEQAAGEPEPAAYLVLILDIEGKPILFRVIDDRDTGNAIHGAA